MPKTFSGRWYEEMPDVEANASGTFDIDGRGIYLTYLVH